MLGKNSLGQRIWNYFEIRQFFLNAKEHNLNFKNCKNSPKHKYISFYDGKSEKQDMHFNPPTKFEILPYAKLFYKKDSTLF